MDRCEIVILEKRIVTDTRKRLWEARSDLNAALINFNIKPDLAQIETCKREIQKLQIEEAEVIQNPNNKPHSIPEYNPESEKWVDLDGS